MSDLVERLRAAASHPYNQHGPHEFLTEAAARIANLEAALREISTLTWTPTDRETYQDLFAEAQNIADAALTAQEKDTQS